MWFILYALFTLQLGLVDLLGEFGVLLGWLLLVLDLGLILGGVYGTLMLRFIVFGLILLILIRLLLITIRIFWLLWRFSFHLQIQNPTNHQSIPRSSIHRNPWPIPFQIITNLPRQAPKKKPFLPLHSLYNLIHNIIEYISNYLPYFMSFC